MFLRSGDVAPRGNLFEAENVVIGTMMAELGPSAIHLIEEGYKLS